MAEQSMGRKRLTCGSEALSESFSEDPLESKSQIKAQVLSVVKHRPTRVPGLQSRKEHKPSTRQKPTDERLR